MNAANKRAPSWRRRKWVIPLVALLAIFAWLQVQVPINAGPWQEAQARVPRIDFSGRDFTIQNLRDFRYDEEANVVRRTYKNAKFSLENLERGWIGLSHFGSFGLAHSFFSFEFVDGETSQFLALSVEARLRPGQSYKPLAGLFRRYTKIYVFSTEQDLIGLRSHRRGERVLLYPVNVSKDELRNFFLAVAADANALQAKPAFYNTILDNCLTNLLKHTALVDEISSTNIKVLLPGRIDRVTYAFNITPANLPFHEARQLATVNAQLKSIDDPAFSASLRCGWTDRCY